MFDKIKKAFENFDLNTFVASLVATIGAISTDTWLAVVYTLVAVTAQIYTLVLASSKQKMENKTKSLQDNLIEQSILSERLDNRLKEVKIEIEIQKLTNGK